MAVPEVLKEKAVVQLSAVLASLDEFKGDKDGIASYAEAFVKALGSSFVDKESFRDQLMSVLANVRSLDGELGAIAPAVLASMKPDEMLSARQRRDRNRFLRKRAREQTVYDPTRMLCAKCKLVRPDRLNINQLALDSEENGTQFDYNYDNMCQCSHESEDDSASVSSSGTGTSSNTAS